MTAVSANNKAWSILTDIKNALIAASVGGDAVFDRVAVTTSISQGRDVLLSEKTVGVILFDKMHQQDDSNVQASCLLKLRLFLAGKADGDSGRVEEALRLVCIAKNVIETGPPSDAVAILNHNGMGFHAPLQWGDVKLDSGDRGPWGICELPLEVAFELGSRTGN